MAWMLRTIALVFVAAALVGCGVVRKLSEVANERGNNPLNFPSEVRKGETIRGSMTYYNKNEKEPLYIRHAKATVRLTGTNTQLGYDSRRFAGEGFLIIPPRESRTIDFEIPTVADRGSGSAEVEVSTLYYCTDRRMERVDTSLAPLLVKD